MQEMHIQSEKQTQKSYSVAAPLPEEERDTLKSRLLQQPSDIQVPIVTNTSHHHHRHRHHHRKHSAIITSLDDSVALQKERKMQRLREERLQRETEERKRSTALFVQQLKQYTFCSTNNRIQRTQILFDLIITMQLVTRFCDRCNIDVTTRDCIFHHLFQYRQGNLDAVLQTQILFVRSVLFDYWFIQILKHISSSLTASSYTNRLIFCVCAR